MHSRFELVVNSNRECKAEPESASIGVVAWNDHPVDNPMADDSNLRGCE